MNNIAARLREARERLGLSQEEVAKRAARRAHVPHIAQSFVAALENGHQKSSKWLPHIAAVLDVPLVEGSNLAKAATQGKFRTMEPAAGGYGAPGDASPIPSSIESLLRDLGERLMRTPPKTREAVASLLATYASDPSEGERIVKAISTLLENDS